MNTTDSLRELLVDASQSAPTDIGLLNAVQTRARRRHRRMQAACAGMTAVTAVAAFGLFKSMTAPSQPSSPRPPGPTASSQVTAVSLVRLVPFVPPTFPYRPAWTPGDYQIAYDETGVDGFGVKGMQLNFDPRDAKAPPAVVFVSHAKPHINGSAANATVQGRPARVFADIATSIYKDGGTRGTVVCWQSKSEWVTFVVVPGGQADLAVAEANQLEARPVPVTTTFAPSLIPAGTHLAASNATQLVLAPNDPQHGPRINVLLLSGFAGAAPPYKLGDNSYMFPAEPYSGADSVQVTASGDKSVDLESFVSQMKIYDAQWVPVPK